MKYLFVTAEDYGLEKHVSQGILQACSHGIVTGISVLVNKASEEEMLWLKDCRLIGLGVHLNLNRGKPILPPQAVPSLVDNQGFFLPTWKDIRERAHPEEIEKEYDAQIQRFLSYQLPLHHLNTHLHLHIHPQILDIVIRLAKRYHTAVRSPTEYVRKRLKEENIPTTDHFLYDFYDEPEITPNGFLRLLSELPEGTTEMTCHPGIVTEALFSESRYVNQRGVELGTLTRKDIRDFLKRKRIRLCSFARDIKKLTVERFRG
ncbi:MAG: carbohydrate deacetylase [bacterium JZ-2024 1]